MASPGAVFVQSFWTIGASLAIDAPTLRLPQTRSPNDAMSEF